MLFLSAGYSKGQLRDNAKLEAVRPLLEVGIVLGRAIQQRVFVDADAVGAEGFRYGRRRPVKLSKAYAALVGARVRFFKHSAAFHGTVRVRPGTFRTSGALARSMQVRASTPTRLNFEFHRSSLGWGGTKSVSNALKAASIWRTNRVHLLCPSIQEERSLLDALQAYGFKQLTLGFGGVAVQSSVPARGNPRLTEALLNAWGVKP